MATAYPQGYQQAGVVQPVVIQVVQQQKSSSNGFLKVCGCLAGTGLAICVGIVAGFLLMIGSILIAFSSYMDSSMTAGIVLVVIGGILLIGSCYACKHFHKELNEDNNASVALMGGQQQTGRVYAQQEAAAAGHSIITPVISQPPPGVAYPGQQQQQVPMPPGQTLPPFQPGYIPGQMGGPVPAAAAYPGQPVAAYPGQPAAAYPGQPAAAYPGQPAPAYPGQPAPPYSGQMYLTKAGEAAAASAPMVPSGQTSEYDRPPPYAP